MNDDAVILDQADEEALIYDVSDEELEATAYPGRATPTSDYLLACTQFFLGTDCRRG